MDIEEKNIPYQKVAIMNYKGDMEHIEVLISKLLGWIESEEIETYGNIFAIYYNNPKRFRQKEDIVYDLGIPVNAAQDIEDTELIKTVDMIEHTVLSGIHNGDLNNIQNSYVEMADYAEKNNYDIIGSPKEIYIKNKYEVESPEEMVTEIQLPVIKM